MEEPKEFNEKELEQAVRIIGKLISSKVRKNSEVEVAESRVDCIADNLGMERHQVIHLIQKLRNAKVRADAKDLTSYMEEGGPSQEPFIPYIVLWNLNLICCSVFLVMKLL